MTTHDDDLKSRRKREEERLRELVKRRPLSETEFAFKGVLLSDAIERCCQSFGLITPFDKENLKPANYKLRIGDEYAIRGKIRSLSDTPEGSEIRIEPFEVAVIKTLETINMPRFLIGRWNIQVSRAYEGLFWVGGPQVDAGYVGHLFCPIYNLSDKPVILHYGEPIAVIDFERTSEFHEGHSKQYETLPERILFQDYKPESLESGLATQAKNKIDAFGTRLEGLSSRMDFFITIVVALLGILFAAGAVFVTDPHHSLSWEPSVFWICAVAVALSGWALLRSGSPDGAQGSRLIQITLWIVLSGLFAGGVSWEWHLQTQLDGLKSEIQKTGPATPAGSGSADNQNR